MRLDPNFVYPSNRNCPGQIAQVMSEVLKYTTAHRSCLGWQWLIVMKNFNINEISFPISFGDWWGTTLRSCMRSFWHDTWLFKSRQIWVVPSCNKSKDYSSSVKSPGATWLWQAIYLDSKEAHKPQEIGFQISYPSVHFIQWHSRPQQPINWCRILDVDLKTTSRPVCLIPIQ
jgi:hypothetical protein